MSITPQAPARHSETALLLAAEVLLADPEALGDDVLESCLYILHDQLPGQGRRESLTECVRSGLATGRAPSVVTPANG